MGILLGIHLLYLGSQAEAMKVVFEVSTTKRKRICDDHYIQAARYITGVIAVNGTIVSGYAKTEDIPVHLVEALNNEATKLDANLKTTARDVSIFVSDCFDRYWEGGQWLGGSLAAVHQPDEITQRTDGVEDVMDHETATEQPLEPVLDSREHNTFATTEQSCSRTSVLSTQTTDWIPECYTDDSIKDSDLPAQDTSLLNKYFLVEGEQLMALFRFCPKCGHSLEDRTLVRLTANGTAPVVHYICEHCHGLKPKRWEGQRRASDHPREKIFLGNISAAVAAITTGLRYVDKNGLNLASDGSYDSRGYSALIGKVVLADLSTKLVLRTEVLHRQCERKMELEGTRRALKWAVEQGFRVNSLTTDRSRSIAALLRELKPELGPITHFYDGWHMIKWVGNKLREESKGSGCAPIAVWIESVKIHLWNSIKVGAGKGDMVNHVFNTCLMHVRNVHQWAPTPETGRYTMCGHAPLPGPRPETMIEGSKAFVKFRNVILHHRLQEDLAKASPFGGTSICEAKNALDRIYCRKEIFYPKSTYTFYAKMATMHFNTLRLAEMAGERKPQRELRIQRKYLTRPSKM
ncbi:hypothetical protein OESDEN_15214, partial [Oesophagostomum dentatum]